MSEAGGRERWRALGKFLKAVLLNPPAFTMLGIIGLSPFICNLVAYLLLRSLLVAPGGSFLWSGAILGGLGMLAAILRIILHGIRARRMRHDPRFARQGLWSTPILFAFFTLLMPSAVMMALMPDPGYDVTRRDGRITHVRPEPDARQWIRYAENRGILTWLFHY